MYWLSCMLKSLRPWTTCSLLGRSSLRIRQQHSITLYLKITILLCRFITFPLTIGLGSCLADGVSLPLKSLCTRLPDRLQQMEILQETSVPTLALRGTTGKNKTLVRAKYGDTHHICGRWVQSTGDSFWRHPFQWSVLIVSQAVIVSWEEITGKGWITELNLQTSIHFSNQTISSSYIVVDDSVLMEVSHSRSQLSGQRNELMGSQSLSSWNGFRLLKSMFLVGFTFCFVTMSTVGQKLLKVSKTLVSIAN